MLIFKINILFFLDSMIQHIVKSSGKLRDSEKDYWGTTEPQPENIFPVPEGWYPQSQWVMEKPKTKMTTTTTTTMAIPTTNPPTTVQQTTAPLTTALPTTVPPTTYPTTTVAPTTIGLTSMVPTVALTTAAPSTPAPTTPMPSSLFAAPAPPNLTCSQDVPACEGVKISEACTNISETRVPVNSTIYSLCACIQNNDPGGFTTIQQQLLKNRYFACRNVIYNAGCNPAILSSATNTYYVLSNTPRILDCDAFERYVIGDIGLDQLYEQKFQK